MARYVSVAEIVNRAAVGCGLTPSPDVFGSVDFSFVQLRTLLTTVGEDLVYEHQWEELQVTHTFTTTALDSGTYNLPEDFAYLLPQTAWSRTNDIPLAGPLSPQDWAFVSATDSVNALYIAFRFNDGVLQLWPQPPAPNIEISYAYMTTSWLTNGAGTTGKPAPTANDDIVRFPDNLMVKALKRAFLGARGFDTTKADREYERIFNLTTGADSGAPIISTGRTRRGLRLLNVTNLPDTGYGG